jgi:hypothetical protein
MGGNPQRGKDGPGGVSDHHYWISLVEHFENCFQLGQVKDAAVTQPGLVRLAKAGEVGCEKGPLWREEGR